MGVHERTDCEQIVQQPVLWLAAQGESSDDNFGWKNCLEGIVLKRRRQTGRSTTNNNQRTTHDEKTRNPVASNLLGVERHCRRGAMAHGPSDGPDQGQSRE